MSAGTSPFEPQSNSILSSSPIRRSRTAPSRATDLPASPPPTSPLPPTPTPDTLLTYLSIPHSRPPRPPRPRKSLPSLHSRTSTLSIPNQSDLKQQAALPEYQTGEIQCLAIPPDSQPLIRKPVAEPYVYSTDSSAPIATDSTETYNSTKRLDSPGSFTTAVFNALPLENWPLPTEWPLLPSSRDHPASKLLTPRSPQHKAGAKRNNKPPTKAVARTALYIPSSRASDNSIELSTENKPLLDDIERAMTFLNQEDDITSLPQWSDIDHSGRFPSSGSISAVVNTKGLTGKRSDVLLRSLLRRRSSMPLPHPDMVQARKFTSVNPQIQHEALARVSQIPLAHRNNMGWDTRRVLNGETVPLPWYVRQRRYMWMLATLIVVLIVSAGVLGGILWKLKHM